LEIKPYTSYNLYFIIPYALWLIAGGIVLFSFDAGVIFRVVNTHYNKVLDWLMYYATWLGQGVVITSIYLVLFISIKSLRNKWFFIAAIGCSVTPTIISQILKHWYDEPRPMFYFEKEGWVHYLNAWGDKLYKNSFPSGHSTGAFSMFLLLSMLLPKRYRVAGLLFFVLAFMVAYSRLYLAAHFFKDVYIGSLVGGCTAMIVFMLLKRYMNIFFKNTKPAE
jgi:membrane-associated phospholipid phosphatase